MIHYLYNELFKNKKISFEWNFFVEGHGKSICDTHFSVVSKKLKNSSKYNFIKSTEHLIKLLKEDFENDKEIYY